MAELTRPINGVALRMVDPIYFVSLDDLCKPVAVLSRPGHNQFPAYAAEVEIKEKLSPLSFNTDQDRNWPRERIEEELVELHIVIKVPRDRLRMFPQ